MRAMAAKILIALHSSGRKFLIKNPAEDYHMQFGFLSAKELKKVKGYMAGAFARSVQTPEELARQLAGIEFFGLPRDYLQTYIQKLNAVSLAQANRVARAYVAPQNLSVVLVAPASKVAGQLKGLGDFETKPAVSVGK